MTGHELHGHVFHRVHREIGAAARQRVFQFFHEKTFAADLCERTAQPPVAFR